MDYDKLHKKLLDEYNKVQFKNDFMKNKLDVATAVYKACSERDIPFDDFARMARITKVQMRNVLECKGDPKYFTWKKINRLFGFLGYPTFTLNFETEITVEN